MEEKQGLGTRIVKGALWTVLMRTSIRLLGVISVLLLARLLVPADFGLVAKAVLVSGLLEMLTQFGFATALIKNQNADQHDYNTVWTLAIIRALCLGLILILFSSPLAQFLQDDRLQLVLCCYGLALLIGGASNVGIVDFHKKMMFHLDFRFNLYLKLSSFVTTLTIALLWQSYWAFPLGILVQSAVKLIISFRLSHYRPRLTLCRWRTLFHFSKWMFGYELLCAISVKLDTFILSRFSTAEDLGLYTVAYEIAGTPSTEIAQPVARASLPGLSKLNHQPEQFKEMYAHILGNVLMLALPAGIGVSILAEPITNVLLGPKWSDATPYIQILALFGITRVFAATSASALVAFGRVDLLTKMTTAGLLLRLSTLPLGFYLGGSLGLCVAILISGLLNMGLTLAVQQYAGAISLGRLLGLSWRLCLASGVMYLGLDLLIGQARWLLQLPEIAALAVEVVIGAGIFTSSLLISWIVTARQDGPERQLIHLIQTRFSFSK